MFNRKFLQNWAMLLALGIGVVTGLFSSDYASSIAHAVSTVTIKTLQLISLPIVFLSVVSTLSGMESFKKVKNVGLKVFKYTLLTTLIAATIAFVLYLLISPATVGTNPSHLSGVEQPGLLNTLLNLYPSNIVQIFTESNVMGIVLVAFALGMSILSLKEEQRKPLHKLFSGLFAAFLKIAGWVIKLLPIGVWAFVTLFIENLSKGGISQYHSLFYYLIVVVGANLIQGIIVLPALLKIKGFSPIKVFRGMSQAISMAFFSKSSNAALPVTMSNIEENLNVPRKISSFSLPLCSTINMNGCAAFIFTTVLFVSMSFGLTFSIFDMIAWVFIATLAAIGNAGVPMGCYFLSGALLTGLGVPLDLLGLILPVYALIDMIETALNVWSDSCVTTIVAKESVIEELPQEIETN